MSILGIENPIGVVKRWRIVPSSLVALVLFLVLPFLCTPPQVPGAPSFAVRGSAPLQGSTPYEELPVHEIVHAAFVMNAKARDEGKIVWLRGWQNWGLAALRARGPSHAASWLRARNAALPPGDHAVAPLVLRGPPSVA